MGREELSVPPVAASSQIAVARVRRCRYWDDPCEPSAIDDLAAGRPVRTAETKAYGCTVKYR